MSERDARLGRIRVAMPGIETAGYQVIDEGMVNDIVIVNDDLVFRFPKTAQGQADLARETTLLEVVRQCVSLPVPEPVMHGPDLASHRLVGGSALTREALYRMPEADRQAAMLELGTFLRQMHGIPAAAFAGVGPSHSVRTLEQWRRMYGRIEEALFPLLFRHQRQAVADHFGPVLDGRLEMEVAPVPIHGDLAPYHILVDPETSRLTGVIDFGTAGLGDPADDIGALLAHYGAALVDLMGPAYPIDDAMWARARFRAGCLELEWALIGVREQDFSMLVAHIGGARDYPPLAQGVPG
jgi:aminoglycoside 2''-phosphotransferase